MLGSVDLTGVAEELYGLPPGEFTARRNALAREATDAGDSHLAGSIKQLAKPTTAAWVVNLLVRHDPDQVQQILDLASALHGAQEARDGTQLRELGRRRRKLTAALTRQARSMAAEHGTKIGDAAATQVEQTLRAAMSDPGAAAAVRTGLLVRPLAVTGIEVGDVSGRVAVPAALGSDVVRRSPERAGARRPRLAVVEDESRLTEEAESRVSQAEAALAEAEQQLDKARRKVRKRQAKALQLGAELDELRRQVADVEERLEANEEKLAEAEGRLDDRQAQAEWARGAAQRARAALQDLGRGSGSRSGP